MSRYIDAERLQEVFKELHGGKRSLLIDTEPTADVVEVVRCKDCKHYDTESRTFPCCTDIFGAVRYMEADGFCSKGERRAD